MQMSGWTISEFAQVGIGSQWQTDLRVTLSGQCQYAADMVWVIVGANYQLNLFMLPVHHFFEITQYIFLAAKMYVSYKQAIVFLHNKTVCISTFYSVYLHRKNQGEL